MLGIKIYQTEMGNTHSKVKFLTFLLLSLLLLPCFSYGAEYCVREVSYTVYPQGAQAEVHATAIVESLQKERGEAKLLSSDVSLLSFEANRWMCRVTARPQGYFLFLPRRGSYSIRYSFKVPLKAEQTSVYLKFSGLSSNLRKLEIKTANIRDVSVTEGILKDNIWYLNPGSEVEASFVPVSEEIREVIINTKLNLLNHVLENRLSSSYNWNFKIEKGKIDKLEFIIPKEVRVLSLKSTSGIQRWWMDEKGERLTCQFQDKLKDIIPLSIETDRTFSSLPFSGVFEPIKPLNVTRVEGEISFISEPYLSIERGEENNLYRTAVDKKGVLARYLFSTIDFSLGLKIDTKSTEFKVSTIQFLTLERYRQRLTIVADFRILKQKLYQIEAQIPEGMVVTSVTGDDIKDWEVEENRLKIKLAQPKEKSYSIEVNLEKPYLELPQQLQFEPVTFLKSAETGGYLGVGSPLAVELIALKTLKVSPIEGKRVEWPKDTPLPKLSYRFRDEGGQISFKLEKVEPVITAQTFSLYTLSERYLMGNITIEYKIDKAPVTYLGILIPSGLEEVRILGDNIRSKERPKPKEKDFLYYGVELSREVRGYYSILVTFRKELQEKKDLEIPQVLASDIFRQSGEVVIASFLSLEISEAKRDGLESIDAKDIIPRHRGMVLAPIYLAYRQEGETFELTLKHKRYEEIVFPSGVIERAEARSVASREGEIVTQVTYFLKNRTMQFLRFKLPPGAELWTAFVGDEASVPKKDGEWILIDVPPKDEITMVDIKYALQKCKLSSLKKVDFSLPQASNPISFTQWTLYLPRFYSYHFYRGNMAIPDIGFNLLLNKMRHLVRLIRNFLIRTIQLLVRYIVPLIIVLGAISIVVILVRRAIRGGRRRIIELLAVVVILAVIAGMFLPALGRSREQARRSSSMNNLKQIGSVLHMFAQDHNGRFPDALEELYPDYIGDKRIFRSPVASEEQEQSYILTPGLTESSPSDTILARERLENYDYQGTNVLYVDGHVAWVPSSKLPALPEEKEISAWGLPLRIEIPKEGIPLRLVRALNLEPDACRASFWLLSRRWEKGIWSVLIVFSFVLLGRKKLRKIKIQKTMKALLFLIGFFSFFNLSTEANELNEINFSSIDIEGVTRDDQCFFTITCNIEVPKEKRYSSIPIISNGSVRKYHLRDGKGTLIIENDTYYLLPHRAGKFSLVLDYMRDLEREGSWEYFTLTGLPVAAKCRLLFKIPYPEINLKEKNHLILEKRRGDGYVQISGFPRPGEVVGLWWEKELKEKVEEKAEHLVQSRNLFELYPNYQKLVSRYEVSIPSGKIKEISIQLKENLLPVEVKGEGIIDWWITEKKLKMLFSEERGGRFPVEVTYEGILEMLPSYLTLSIPSIEGEIRHSGTIEVKTFKELESEVLESFQLMRLPHRLTGEEEEKTELLSTCLYCFGNSEAYLKICLKPLSAFVSYQENSLIHLEGGIERIATDIKGEVKKTKTYALHLKLPSGYRILNVEDSLLLQDTVWDLLDEDRCIISYSEGLIGEFHIRVLLEKEHSGNAQRYCFLPIVLEKANFEKGLLGIEDMDKFELKEMVIEGGYEIDPEKGKAELGTKPVRLIRLTKIPWEISFTRFEVPVEMEVESSHLLEVAEGFIRGKGFFNYRLRKGRCQNFCLLLPSQAEKVFFKGASIRSVTSKKTEKEQVWDIQLSKPVRDCYDLILDYEVKYELKKNSDTLGLWQIHPLNIHREKGFLGIVTSTGFEIKSGEVKGLRVADAEEVPSNITGILPSPLLLAYRFTEKLYQLNFEVMRHPHTPLLEAVINNGKLSTVVTPEGREITHLLLHIYNKSEQFLEVELPPDSSIWHASVDGQVVKPAKGPEGDYLLPLEKDKTGGEGFEVEMAYVRKQGIFQRLNLKLRGPVFSLPSSGIDWELYLPEDRWFYRFKGNLNQVTKKGEKIRFSFLRYKDLEKKWEGKKKVSGERYSKAGKKFRGEKDYSQAIQQYQRAMRYDARQKDVQNELEETIVAQNVAKPADEELLRQGISSQQRITIEQAKAITGGQIDQLQALTSTGVVLPLEGIRYSFSKEFITSPGTCLVLSASFLSPKTIFIGFLVALIIVMARLISRKVKVMRLSMLLGMILSLSLLLSSFSFAEGEETIPSQVPVIIEKSEAEKTTSSQVQWIIKEAQYEGRVEDKKILFTAIYKIEGQGKGEASLPFYDKNVIFLSTNLSSGKGVFVPDGRGGMKLALFNPGRINFKVTFLSSLENVDGWQKLTITLPQSVITHVNIILPGKGYKVRRFSSFAFEQKEEKRDTMLKIDVGVEREVALSFKKEEALPGINCEFHLADTIVVSLEGIRRDVEVNCMPISGQVTILDILLNKEEKVTGISSSIPHVWRQDEELLRINLIEPCEKNFSVTISTNISKIQMDTTTFIRSLKIKETQRFGGILRLRVDKRLEVKVIEFERLKKFGEILDGISDAYMFVEDYQMKLRISPKASKITSKTNQRFEIQETKLTLALKSQLTVEDFPVYSLKFGVPPEYNILEVNSPGLTDWSSEDKNLVLKYGQGLLGSVIINLIGEKKLDGLAQTSLDIEGIRFPSEIEDRGEVEIETELPLQIRPKDLHLLIETASRKEAVKEGKISILYGYRNPDWSLVLERELLTPSITAKIDTRIRLKRDFLEGESNLNFNISDAGIKEIDFSLTGDVEGVDIKGGYIRSTELPGEGKDNKWKVILERHILGDYRLQVNYKQYISPEMESLSLPALTIGKVETVQGKIEITPVSSLEVTAGVLENLEESGQLTYTYYRQPYNLNMKLKFLDQTGVLQTVVEKGNITSTLSSTGEVMTRAIISLKNTLNQYLKVSLPEGAILWQVKVDGRSVRPGRYENGYLIPLGGRSARFRSIPIELIYVENSRMSLYKFPDYLKLTSPSFVIPAKSMDWTVYLPHRIKRVRFKSNLEKSTFSEIEKTRKEVQLARYDTYKGELGKVSEAELLEAGAGEGLAVKKFEKEEYKQELRPHTKLKPTTISPLKSKEAAAEKELQFDVGGLAAGGKGKVPSSMLGSGILPQKKLEKLSEDMAKYADVKFQGKEGIQTEGKIQVMEPVEAPAPFIPPLAINISQVGRPYYFYRAILTPAQGPLYIKISRKEIKYLKIIVFSLSIIIPCFIAYKIHIRRKKR